MYTRNLPSKTTETIADILKHIQTPYDHQQQHTGLLDGFIAPCTILVI
jgi:hypothetical protein